jgi:hypothetical protein
MDETQTLAARALRELLDTPERDDWDELERPYPQHGIAAFRRPAQ